MPPKPDITVSMDAQLIEDLEELADRNKTHRSAEVTAAAMCWVNAMIRSGELDRPYEWDPEDHHESVRGSV